MVLFTLAAPKSERIISDATQAKDEDDEPRGWSGLTTWHGKPRGVCSLKRPGM